MAVQISIKLCQVINLFDSGLLCNMVILRTLQIRVLFRNCIIKTPATALYCAVAGV